MAIGLRDIAEVGPNLLPGTAVVLAWGTGSETGCQKRHGKASDPADARLERSLGSKVEEAFDFLRQGFYSKATENFDAFRQNKERLFQNPQFHQNLQSREIHVLEGPGYWVTWTEQFYTASNLSTEGIRRLYWQKGEDNKFRIVGMEWTPRDVGDARRFPAGATCGRKYSQFGKRRGERKADCTQA